MILFKPVVKLLGISDCILTMTIFIAVNLNDKEPMFPPDLYCLNGKGLIREHSNIKNDIMFSKIKCYIRANGLPGTTRAGLINYIIIQTAL